MRAEIEVLRASLRVGPVELRAGGWSMRPVLRPGDTVRIERRSARLGEIVLAVIQGRPVLHRLVQRRAGRALLHGDARPRPDGWVPVADLLGVASARRGRGDEREPWRPLDRARDRWLGLARIAGTAPLRRVRAARGARRGAATSRAG